VGNPVANRGCVALARLCRRSLERPAERPEDPPDMARMISHPRAPLDYRRDPWQRPEVRRKSVRAGARAERLVDVRQLRRGEAWLAPSPADALQRGGAAALQGVVPAAHALPADPQRAGDGRLEITAREHPRRLLAALLRDRRFAPITITETGDHDRAKSVITISEIRNYTMRDSLRCLRCGSAARGAVTRGEGARGRGART